MVTTRGLGVRPYLQMTDTVFVGQDRLVAMALPSCVSLWCPRCCLCAYHSNRGRSTRRSDCPFCEVEGGGPSSAGHGRSAHAMPDLVPGAEDPSNALCSALAMPPSSTRASCVRGCSWVAPSAAVPTPMPVSGVSTEKSLVTVTTLVQRAQFRHGKLSPVKIKHESSTINNPMIGTWDSVNIRSIEAVVTFIF